MDHSSHDTVITLWFVTATHPEKVIATMPRADRGFGRKLLSQLNPRWPITPIGQFALNRSAQPSRSEFYIAGFPGLSIIQTVVDDFTMISGIDQALRTAIPAENVYAIATNAGTSYGAFAHWSRGNLKRAFAAVNERVYEDLGLVETFESSYWAGYHTTETSGLTLPFSPIDLALHAQRSWLGFDMATCPDINIVAYAVDGRPEPKITYRQPIDARPLTERTTTKLSLGSTRSNGEFDDYELPDEFDDVDGTGTKYAEEAVALTKKSVTKTKGFAARFRERLAGIGHGLKERLRHTDRPTPQPKKPAALPSAANTQPKATKEATKDKKKTDHASATEAKAAKASESSSAKQTTTKAVSTKSISTTDAIGTDAIANKSTASQGAAQGKDQQNATTKTAQPAATAATKKPADAADTTETIDSQAVKAGVKKAQATASASKPADKPKEAAQTAKEASVQKAESTGTKPAAAATAKPVTSKTAAAAADSAKPKATKTPVKTTAKATKATKTATKATKTVKKTTTKAVKRTTKATAKATTKAPETAAFPSSESATAAKPAPKSGIRVPAKSTTSAQKPAPAESPETKAFPAETSPAEDAPQKKRRTLGTRTTRSKKS